MFGQKSKNQNQKWKTVLVLAMMVAWFLLSGVAMKIADAGIVTQFGSMKASTDYGTTQVVANGGNLLWFSAEYNDPQTFRRETIYSSAVLLGDGRTVVGQTHQYRSFLNLDPIFRVGTGSNYLVPSLRGDVYRLQSFALDPLYQNNSSYAITHGLAVGIVEFPIPVQQGLVIGSAQPGDVLRGAGFGLQGVLGGGTITTGAANGGSMFVVPPGGNFASTLFTNTIIRNSSLSPSDWSMLSGDSGSILLNAQNEWVASGAAGNGQGGASWSSSINSTEARLFIAQNSFTAVPEPASLLIVAAAIATSYSLRRYRKCSTAEATF